VNRARAILIVVCDGAGTEGRAFREFWLADLRGNGSGAPGARSVDLDDDGRPAETPPHVSDWIEAVPRGTPPVRRNARAGEGVLVTDGAVAELLAQEFLDGFEDGEGLRASQRDLDALRAGAGEGWSSDRREAVAEAQRALNAAVRASRFRWPVVLTVLGAREEALERDFRSLDLERGVIVEAVHGPPLAPR